MEEKEIRLDEVLKLETYLDHSQILAGPVRNYVSHRRMAIETDFPGALAATEASPEELRQKAIEHVKSKGYTQEAAEEIVKEWGPEKILSPEPEVEEVGAVAGQAVGPTDQAPANEAPAAPAEQKQDNPPSGPPPNQPPAEQQQS